MLGRDDAWTSSAKTIGSLHGDTEVTSEHMTEEDLLKGIEGLALVPREEPEEEPEEPREQDADLRY